MVLNLALGRWVLKEKAFSPIIITACVFLVGGSIVAIVFANYDDSESLDIVKISELFFKPMSLVLIGLNVVVFGVGMFMSDRILRV